MEKQIVNIFLFLGFNYYMIKSWGTRKVTVLTLIGNYFLISILIESYFGLPKFIEDFNALFMLGIGMVGTYILWRKNKAGTLTEYEKRGWILTVNDTLRMYKNDDIRMYNFNCITDTIVEVITTCNTYTLLTVHLL